MRFGGWTRIWIALSVLLGFLVSFIAYEDRPTRERVVSDWVEAASVLISEKVTIAENQQLSSYAVRNAYFNKSERENLELLKEFEISPSEKAELFSSDLALINKKYESRLESMFALSASHWGKAFIWWLVISVLIYSVGWTVGWIIRGFHQPRI